MSGRKLRTSACGAITLFVALLLAVPAHANRYSIAITDGATFSIPATLTIFRTVNTNPEIPNGVNPFDVSIVTNQPPTLGVKGALWFGTNTSLCVVVRCTIGASGIDIAFVNYDPNRRLLTIQVDGNVFGLPAARLDTFNIYNITTGLTAQVHNILAGTIVVQFSPDFRVIEGRMQLLGSSGFQGPTPTSSYVAGFRGSFIGN